MWRFLVGLGGFTLVLGLLTIVFGSVIFVSTIGNALISTGAIGFTGGALIIAVALLLREVERLRTLVEQGGSLGRRVELDLSERLLSEPPAISDAALLAVSEAVEPQAFAADVPPPPPAEPPAPAPVAAEPAPPRRRPLSFADRLRPAEPTPLAPPEVAPEPSPEPEVPVAERRGRILGRSGEPEATLPLPRPRSLLDRMSLGRSAPERPPLERPVADRPAPDRTAPERPVPERAPLERPAAEAPPPVPPAPSPDFTEYAEPEPAAAPAAGRPYGAPPPRPAPEPMVLKSGIVGGMAYTLYSDGSIQAELPDGVVRFASLMELREHVSRANPPA